MAGSFRPSDTAARPFLGVERSVTGRVWRDRLDERTSRTALAIAQGHGLSEIIARVLAGRGVTSADLPAFLDPTLRSLMPDPSVLTDMDAAAERIASAVERGEQVAIFGDYDVDGASSAAILTRFLRSQGLSPTIYIPDRLFEGYGPNPQAMAVLAAAGSRLVVTVDCGTTSLEALESARKLALDVVVIDHHQIGASLPIALAVVNPNRADDLSGLGHLAAAGLVFLTVVAVNRALRRKGWFAAKPEPDLLAFLDLVALATVCDVVPLSGLNRAFVAKGLAVLGRGGNTGLAALGPLAGLSSRARSYHLAFLLGPRINAGGRIGDAALGARLLASDDPAECETMAAELDRLNRERQAIERAMLDEAVAEAEAEIGAGEGPPVLVTVGRTWHSGVVGLIAARLRERFHRPAFAIALGPDGIGTGSGRSIPGVDLGKAVRAALERGIVVKGGGHAMAAGVTVSADNLAAFRSFLLDRLGSAVDLERATHALEIDGALSARAIDPDFIDLLEHAGPYGAGHPEPVFALPSHRVAYAEALNHSHVRVELATGDDAKVKGIAFRSADTPLGAALLSARGSTLHTVGTLGLDEWQGRRVPFFRIIDAATPSL